MALVIMVAPVPITAVTTVAPVHITAAVIMAALVPITAVTTVAPVRITAAVTMVAPAHITAAAIMGPPATTIRIVPTPGDMAVITAVHIMGGIAALIVLMDYMAAMDTALVWV